MLIIFATVPFVKVWSKDTDIPPVMGNRYKFVASLS